jgi:4a-hydroxytetrahydrobiopterin dehydratase
MPGLAEDEIAQALADLPAWGRSGDAIVRTVRFAEFMEGIRFVSRVAELAEAADHHPDIDIRYRNVTLSLSTHDQRGLTVKDFNLARQINEELKRQQGKGGQA